MLSNTDGSLPHVVYTLSYDAFSPSFDPKFGQWYTGKIIWSPDGARLAFDVSDDGMRFSSFIDVITIGGTLVQRFGGSYIDLFASNWLSNSDSFAYAGSSGVGTRCDAIYIRTISKMTDRFLAGCDDFDENNPVFGLLTIPAPCNSPHIGLDLGTLRDFAWSSDNKYVAMAIDDANLCAHDILIMNRIDNSLQSLPYYAAYISFSPDNQAIAYVQYTGDESLCVVRANGSNNHCGTATKDPVSQYATVQQIEWLPNNLIAVVISNNPKTGGDSQICVVDPDTFKQRCLTDILPGSATIVN